MDRSSNEPLIKGNESKSDLTKRTRIRILNTLEPLKPYHHIFSPDLFELTGSKMDPIFKSLFRTRILNTLSPIEDRHRLFCLDSVRETDPNTKI